MSAAPNVQDKNTSQYLTLLPLATCASKLAWQPQASSDARLIVAQPPFPPFIRTFGNEPVSRCRMSHSSADFLSRNSIAHELQHQQQVMLLCWRALHYGSIKAVWVLIFANVTLCSTSLQLDSYNPPPSSSSSSPPARLFSVTSNRIISFFFFDTACCRQKQQKQQRCNFTTYYTTTVAVRVQHAREIRKTAFP